nr:choline kinase family protein [Thermoactinospora rubra]
MHGDLGAENVLWEWEDGLPRLSGVIDWDEVAIGDPAEDLAAVEAGYGSRFAHRVRTLGGWPDSTTTRIAAIRATFALQQALSAHRDGDAEQLADGLAGYR